MEAKRFFVYTRSQPRAVGLVPVSALDDPAASFLSIKVHRVTSDSDEDVQIEVNRESVQQSLRMYSPLDIDPVYGIVGILDYLNDTHLFLVKACQPVCNLAELRGEQKTVFRILRVTSLSLVDSTYDMLASNRPMGSMDDHATGEMDVYGITNPCAQLNSFLENGAFYFSPSFDLTRSLQSQRLNAMVNEEPGVRDPDEKFHWNSNMLKAIMDYRLHMLSHEERRQFDQDGFVVSLIQGHVGAVYLDALGNLTGTPRSAHMSVFLISRSSSQRSGARFLTRGINDAGAVANEVESEVIIATPQLTFAHVQVRGSVPLFWTQDGFQIGSHRVQVTRSLKASLPATKRHFADLLDRYKRVNVVNLLRMHYVQSYEDMAGGASTGNSGSSEADLGQMYRQQVLAMGLPNELLLYTAYDYNNEVRGGQFDRVKDLVQEIKSLMADYQYFLVDTTSDTILSLQRGVQRTNCLDCLDRTNVVQSVISRYVSGEFIGQNALLSRSAARNAVQHIGSLWGANGNAISRLYAGTGALKNSVTMSGKSGWSGFLSDATKSLSRLMQNNFQDKGKQDVIDTLLGMDYSGSDRRRIVIYDQYHSAIMRDLDMELNKISKKDSLHLMLCTYNMHGAPYRGEPLGTWLAMPRNMRPDFVAIGFQEVVNLDVQSVIAADNSNRRVWESVLSDELNMQHRKAFGDKASGEYVLVSSEQLVGVALLFFAHEDVLPRIHNLQMVKHKTGLAGMAGNKGCVAMHLDLDDSSVCIVAAHLAAGANNVQERNNDYVAIQHGVRFRRGRRVSDHDYAIWLGDLNYRIDLPNDQARRMIAERQVASLMMYDQLGVQMAANNVFAGYSEAEIHFPPTYKYDVGTDVYDTSDKVRVPSWTDRILYKGHNVRILEYYRDELCISDHKPVLAMMEFDVVSVDKVQKHQIIRQLYTKYHQGGAAGVKAEASGGAAVEQNLIDWDSAPEKGTTATELEVKSSRAKPPPPPSKKKAALPPPSSDSHAWWDDESYTRPAGSGGSGVLSINPYALGRGSLAALTPSSTPYPASHSQAPVNVLDDNDESLVNLTWEPIQPSYSGGSSGEYR